MNKRIVCFFIILFFCTNLLVGQESAGVAKLKAEIQSMSTDPLFKYGQIGFSLRSPEGKVIYEYNGDKSLVPASNLKLVTTATALKVLGNDFRFETKLWYDGNLKNGVLTGNLYIEGGGDPTLGSDRFEGNPDVFQLFDQWSEKIKQAGIVKINGSVVAISSIFESNPVPDGWIWTDIGNYYGAGATGLMINENQYKLIFKPGKASGNPTEILRTEPAISEIQFENQVKTGPIGSGDNAYIYGAPFSNYRFVSGTVPAGVNEFVIKGAMPDASFVCARLLYERLNNNGITVSKGYEKLSDTISSSTPIKNLIHTHRSPELKYIVEETNQMSINLYAEALLKMIAVKKGFKGDTKSGIKVINEYWKGKGLDMQGMFLYDGSGLSPQTAIRPSQMTQMLSLMVTDSVFFNSLPVAGESGTLKKFCKDTPAEKKVFAKSGTLSKVTCYSGFVKSKSGKLNSFSIMINNYNGTNSAVQARVSKVMVLLLSF